MPGPLPACLTAWHCVVSTSQKASTADKATMKPRPSLAREAKLPTVMVYRFHDTVKAAEAPSDTITFTPMSCTDLPDR